jgi:hypothetical protein
MDDIELFRIPLVGNIVQDGTEGKLFEDEIQYSLNVTALSHGVHQYEGTLGYSGDFTVVNFIDYRDLNIILIKNSYIRRVNIPCSPNVIYVEKNDPYRQIYSGNPESIGILNEPYYRFPRTKDGITFSQFFGSILPIQDFKIIVPHKFERIQNTITDQ